MRDRSGCALGGAEVRALPEDPAPEWIALPPAGQAARGIVCDEAGRFAIELVLDRTTDLRWVVP